MVDLTSILARVPNRDSIVSALDRIPGTRDAVSPFVPGETPDAAVVAAEAVLAAGMSVSVAHLPDPQSLASSRIASMQVIEALDSAHMADGADLLVDLVALGLVAGTAAGTVVAQVAALCGAAEQVGMSVTLDAVPHELLDTALAAHSELLADHPDLGMTISANLLRSEADCGDLARAGARVRLTRQDADSPTGLGFTNGHEIDKSFVRCARILLAGRARPILATDDPRLVEIGTALAVRSDRDPSDVEVQFRLGVAADTAADLVAAGTHVRILVPFGPGWAAYVASRISLNPAAVAQAARASMGR